MHFLNQLFIHYANPNRRRVKRLLKNLLLESLEQRIALDASGSPTLDALSDLTIDENAPEQTVYLTGITSGGTDAQWLKITAASDNTGLIPNPSVTPSPMTQPPATGVLSFTPVADQFGTAMITVTAENGGPDNNLETPGNNATLTQTFTVYVTQAGAPTLDPLSDLTIDENAPEQTVYLTGITSGGTEDVQQLKITAASDNTGLIPNPTVTPSSMSQPPDPTGVLSFTPVADQFGTAVITVTAENGGPDNNLATPGNNATLTQTFTVVVTEASNEPDPDAPEVRPQLERVREVHIDNSLAGPDPMVFGKSELVGYDTKSFVITHVAAGSTVEKWDAATNQWRDVSTPPTSSNPRQLLQLLQNRIIQKDDQVRWIPKSTDGVTQKAFEIIGWDDGSEVSEPEGVNVPGAVENLEIELVGDEVQVTWDPPTPGAAVKHYRIHQNPTTVVPSTQTSHTFAKKASPASYAVTVHANSAEGAGEATTVTLSHASYEKTDGTIVDPILDTSGNVLDYDGPNLKARADVPSDANLTGADLRRADLRYVKLLCATLTDADLTGANLLFADLTGVTGSALYNAETIFIPPTPTRPNDGIPGLPFIPSGDSQAMWPADYVLFDPDAAGWTFVPGTDGNEQYDWSTPTRYTGVNFVPWERFDPNAHEAMPYYSADGRVYHQQLPWINTQN
ncbi:MAG: pentapeptide repeat-containing protein [Planctomycetota bacterium]|nr:pentapeptide repeat-containing protein [Planctomycetota bacterium]